MVNNNGQILPGNDYKKDCKDNTTAGINNTNAEKKSLKRNANKKCVVSSKSSSYIEILEL